MKWVAQGGGKVWRKVDEKGVAASGGKGVRKVGEIGRRKVDDRGGARWRKCVAQG